MLMDKIEPIYKFDALKSFLESKGIHVDEADGNGYHPVKPGDVTLQDIKNGTYTFENGGIYLNGKKGERQKVFLYKRKYHISGYDNSKPRMHTRKCTVIDGFISCGTFEAEYRHANTETVPVIDLDDNDNDIMVDNLPLCGYCRSIVIQEGQKSQKEAGIKNSVEFVRLLKETLGVNKDVEVDLFGYVKNWEKISRGYREYKKFTCERCGLQITNPWDYQFMQVHHKNGIKTDNDESNLECLCIRCHANVDAVHQANFSQGDNKFRLDDFNEKYPMK